MIKNGTTTFQDYEAILKHWGMGKAVMAAMTPQAFAVRFAKELPSDTDAMGRRLRWINGFRVRFPTETGAWLQGFFEELTILIPNLPD